MYLEREVYLLRLFEHGLVQLRPHRSGKSVREEGENIGLEDLQIKQNSIEIDQEGMWLPLHAIENKVSTGINKRAPCVPKCRSPGLDNLRDKALNTVRWNAHTARKPEIHEVHILFVKRLQYTHSSHSKLVCRFTLLHSYLRWLVAEFTWVAN